MSYNYVIYSLKLSMTYADSVRTQQITKSFYTICKLNLFRPTVECNYTRLESVPALSCRYQIATYLDC